MFKGHCYSLNVDFRLTVVYASNCEQRRSALWRQLEAVHSVVDGPWLCCGDWNSVRSQADQIGGRPVSHLETSGINDSFMACGLDELASSGHDVYSV